MNEWLNDLFWIACLVSTFIPYWRQTNHEISRESKFFWNLLTCYFSSKNQNHSTWTCTQNLTELLEYKYSVNDRRIRKRFSENFYALIIEFTESANLNKWLRDEKHSPVYFYSNLLLFHREFGYENITIIKAFFI